MRDENPLVSIIVITYNSAKYVLETLESAKEQTYKNIELIVSDDCSSDDTVEICRNWISENEMRFVRTKLITVEKNTGIPANCNRGVIDAQGEWVKIIAGDDLLLKNSLTACIDFVITHINTEIINANVIKFDEHSEKKTTIEEQKIFAVSTSASEQYLYLLRYNRFIAPGIFIKRTLIIAMGGFDEQFPLIEDYPMWLKITSSGVKIHLLELPIVKYRISEDGLSSPKNSLNKKLYPEWMISAEDIRLKYCLAKLPLIEQINLIHEVFIRKALLMFSSNNSKLNRGIIKFSKIFNPYSWYRRYLLIVNKKYTHHEYFSSK